jgi:hypothetical protein
MLDDVDATLRQLLLSQVPGITNPAQVRFQPPDEDWRTYVKALVIAGNHVNALNVYLFDLRENRRLRSNERTKTIGSWDATETPAPRRVDCHYLLSAWSPTDVTPGTEPTLDEHALLYRVALTLSRHDPIVPDQIFAPAAPPAPLAGEVLPLTLLPVDGFPKLAEFWGTMGDKHRLKPCVYFVVTVPLVTMPSPAGPIVTTVMVDGRQRDIPASSEVFGLIGGIVREQATQDPIADAWVEVLTTLGVRLALVRTDADGRFRFEFARAGTYNLRAWSDTLGPASLTIVIPSPTGDYVMEL